MLKLINHLPESAGSTAYFQSLLEFANPKLHQNSVFQCNVELSEMIDSTEGRFHGYARPQSNFAAVFVASKNEITQTIPFLTVSADHSIYTSFMIHSYVELILYLFAHECRHLWQYLLCSTSEQFVPNDKYNWDSLMDWQKKEIHSVYHKRQETDADQFAIQKLLKWRKLQARENEAYLQ